MTGTDVAIARLRNRFANELWQDVSNKVYYAAAYRNNNRNKSGIIAEVYTENNEYKEVHNDDRFNVVSFFVMDNNIPGIHNSAASFRSGRVIFSVNLQSIYPDITYRTEEEVHRDVSVVANKESGIISNMEFDIGLDAYGDLFTDNMKAFNMHPWHTFAMTFTAKIDYTCDQSGIGQARQTWFEYPFPIIFGG